VKSSAKENLDSSEGQARDETWRAARDGGGARDKKRRGDKAHTQGWKKLSCKERFRNLKLFYQRVVHKRIADP